MEKQSISAISVHLCRALDEIGLNELTVKKRRKTYLLMEHTQSVRNQVADDLTSYCFGSQTEGTTTIGLNSDVDVLICHNNINIILNCESWTPDKINFLMLCDSTTPGYCQLQLMKQDKPEPEQNLLYHELTYDDCNRVVARNTFINNLLSELDDVLAEKTGPAHTIQCPDLLDGDVTQAFRCTLRNEATEKWARRKRRSDWPTARLKQQVMQELHCFLVPVGNKLSPKKKIDWRISTSLAERCLMFSLNIVQIKCYVILKILMKTFVTPAVGKSISSCHCKTALFYCIESTEADFWREDNLLPSFNRCLEMLLAWVQDDFCPHYILAESNLFAGKVTSENKDELRSVLHWLAQSTEDALLAIGVDELGQRLRMRLGTRPTGSQLLDSEATYSLLGLFSVHSCPLIHAPMSQHLALYDKITIIRTIRTAITMFASRTYFSDKLHQKATEQINCFLSSFLGSLLASSSLARCDKITDEAMNLLDTSATSEMSSLLKQASIFHCSREIEKVQQLCKKSEGILKQKLVIHVCTCYPHINYPPEICKNIYDRRRSVLFASCVIFTAHEIYCVPHELRYELFKAVGDDIHKREKTHDDWMILAVIDALPFLYYLQYMTYRELGKLELTKRSLQNLERCITEENYRMSHRETAWNILGQCHEMEKQPITALHCYRKSLDIRQRNNAANWLLSLLLYRCTQKQ